MAKNSKKRKSTTEAGQHGLKKPKSDTPNPGLHNDTSTGAAADLIGNLIYQDELDITTDTLTALSQNPELIGLKALKPFKTAIHNYWRTSQEVSGVGEYGHGRAVLASTKHTIHELR